MQLCDWEHAPLATQDVSGEDDGGNNESTDLVQLTGIKIWAYSTYKPNIKSK